MMHPVFLGVSDVVSIHHRAISTYGGERGIRDVNLLESSVYVAQSGSGGSYFHDSLSKMAAAYLFHIVKGHPFIDGNKRAGVMAAYVFLRLNDYDLVCREPDLTALVVGVATGSVDKDEAGRFLEANSFQVAEK